MDLSLVKDDTVWADTVSYPAMADRLVLCVREDLISNISLGKEGKLYTDIYVHRYIQMAFVLTFLAISLCNPTQLLFYEGSTQLFPI